MSTTKQIVAVVGMNTQAIRSRTLASLVIVVGMAAVVAMSLSIFALSAGMREMNRASTSPDRMVVSGQGSIDTGAGMLPVMKDLLPTLANTEGIKKGPDGKPLIYGNVGFSYLTKKTASRADVFVSVNGVSPNITHVRPEVKMIEGRMFTPGLRELIAGSGTIGRYENIVLGKEIRFRDGPWTIVGVYDSSGGSLDYSLLTDNDTLMASMRMGGYNAVFVRLEDGSKSTQDAFKAAVKDNLSLPVDVETEPENRARLTSAPGNPMDFFELLAYGVGGIMGLGATFAALNTMYAAVSARIVEIATLRAIGFGAAPVVMSVILEALALAILGAFIGAAFAWVGFNGDSQNFGNIAVTLAVTPLMAAAGIAASLLVGFTGALFPAVRAARLPVTAALQAK